MGMTAEKIAKAVKARVEEVQEWIDCNLDEKI